MNNKVVKSGFWYVFGEILLRGMSFISAPIFARILTKAEYGNVTNFSAWYSIIIIIGTLNLHSTLIRARYDIEEKIEKYIFSLLVLGSCNTFIIFIFIMFFNEQIRVLFSMEFKYLLWMFIGVLFNPALTFFHVYQRIIYKYKLSIAISIIVSFGNIVLSLLLILIFRDNQMARIVGMQMPTFIASISIYLYYGVKARGINTSYFKYALKISIPYIPHLLALNLLTNMDRIMIKLMYNAEEVAMYSMAYSCAMVVSILLNAMNTAMSPWLGEKLHEKKYAEIKKTTKPYVLVFVIPAIVFMILVPEVLYVVGGKAYIEAKGVLAPLVLACVLQFLYCMYVNIEQYEKKTVGMALGSILAAATNGILNLLLLPIFGYKIAAYTTVVSYLLLLFIHMYLVKRMGLINVYDTKFIIKILCFMIILTLIVVYLYGLKNYIRYICFLIGMIFGMIFIVKNRIAIIRILKKEKIE